MKNNFTCYLDLDGVLTDFHSAAVRKHGFKTKYEDFVWDFDVESGLQPEAFWTFGLYFWQWLPWTKDGKEILGILEEKFGNNIVLLTAPPSKAALAYRSDAAKGKMDWVAREIPRYKDRLFIGSSKHMLASGNKYLVDDYEKNIDLFLENGGDGFLVPRPWNRDSALESRLLENLQLDLKCWEELRVG